jgi:hypothetical protein
MIKVENTKPHKVVKLLPYNNHGHNVVVTDAELVCGEVTSHYKLMDIEEIRGKLRPILISRTEKIEVGDWYLTPSGNIVQSKGKPNFEVSSGWYKILALPEHFSQSTLRAIVDGQLKEGKCLVECELKANGWLHTAGQKTDYHEAGISTKEDIKYSPFIKLNPHITIYPVEEKMYTREEVEIMFGLGAANHAIGKPSFEDALKWFEQNVKIR